MVPVWSISEAKPSDSVAIASLFALSWTSPFAQLQFGHVDSSTLIAAMTPGIALQMESTNVTFVTIRDPETEVVVSVAQWTLYPDELGAAKETPEEQNERQAFEDEIYRMELPKGMNKGLVMEFTIGLRVLRQKALLGQKHYMLENLATHPDYRRLGLASRLVDWVFPRAVLENALVYLDTASDNSAIGMYQRLGFEEQDRHTIKNIDRFAGGQRLDENSSMLEHTHVAFIRYPLRSDAE